jgi:hypothetical protein
VTIPFIWKLKALVFFVKRIRARRKRRMLKGKLTYTGIAVAAVSVVLGWLGVGDEATAAKIVQHGGELVGLAIALYGRYRAAQPE